MADKTKIGWTEATWNPTVGCSIVSAGCSSCYAMKQAGRIVRMTPGSHYAGTVKDSKAGPVWTGLMKQAPEHILTQPLRWRRPRTIFVNSMSDLFHEDVPDEWIDRVFAVMAQAPQHTFQILTKRPERMASYLTSERDAGNGMWMPPSFFIANEARDPLMFDVTDWPLRNVWIGVSAEDQRAADERVPHLLRAPAEIRFVSYEPAIGPVTFNAIQADEDRVVDAINGFEFTRFLDDVEVDVVPALDWIIVGGESHKQRAKARAFHVGWARDVVRQCEATDVAVFMKQLGSNPMDTSDMGTFPVRLSHGKGENMDDWPPSIRVQQYPGRREP